LPTGIWPMCHFAYKIGKLTHRQNDTKICCILPTGQIAYVSFGLRNFCRQKATFSWKQYVHFAYGLLAYAANYLIHEAIYLTHEANYLTHEANYQTHEANYLTHEANYLTHEANAINIFNLT
jgi:hypothetical protein